MATKTQKDCEYLRQWRRDNRDRVNDQQRKRHAAKDPLKVRESNLQRNYGLTLAAWDALFVGQGRCCAVCKCVDAKWHTDHDHKTDELRGILCEACNLGLGKFRDTPTFLRNAADYLDRSR